jgi:hypothetical protein
MRTGLCVFADMTAALLCRVGQGGCGFEIPYNW